MDEPPWRHRSAHQLPRSGHLRSVFLGLPFDGRWEVRERQHVVLVPGPWIFSAGKLAWEILKMGLFYQEWIFINTHAERRWDISLGNEATSGWEASIRGFQGKLQKRRLYQQKIGMLQDSQTCGNPWVTTRRWEWRIKTLLNSKWNSHQLILEQVDEIGCS